MNRKQYSAQILYEQMVEELRAIRFYQQLPETFLIGTEELLLLVENQHKAIFNGLHDFLSSVLSPGELDTGKLMEVNFPPLGKKVDWKSICAEEEKRMARYTDVGNDPQLDSQAKKFIFNQVLPGYETIVDTVNINNIENLLMEKDFDDLYDETYIA